MRSWVLWVLILAGSAKGGLVAPLSGSGDFNFTLDAPVFQDQSGARVDLRACVLHSELRFAEGARSQPFAKLQMLVKAARQGRIAVDTRRSYTVYADDAADALRRDRFVVLDLPIALEPGRWALTVELVDLNRGLDNKLDRNVVSTAQGVIEVARPEPGQALLSDPEFRIRARDGSALSHPLRLYGVVQDTLEAYLELSGARAGQDYVVDVEVRDPVFGGLDSEALLMRPAGEHSAALYRLPLGSFPDGSYRIRLTPQWAPEQSREYEFGVNWRIEQVLASVADIAIEGELVLQGELHDRFRKLSNSGQQSLLAAFWEEWDPTPGTAVNETRERLRARMAYAARNFGSYGLNGALSDRGRIYVRYGAPSEIKVEVIPLNGSDLQDTIGQVHDTYQMERHGTTIKQETDQLMEYTRSAIADRERNANRMGSEGSFELWTYKLDGEPLFDRDRHFSENVDLRFLFVDRRGTGVYELEFSNLPTRE